MEHYKDNAAIQGSCIGIDFTPHGKNDKHVLIEIAVEDDEQWFPKLQVSSYWIDDMIRVLQKAKAHMEKNHKKGQWGYEFKS